MTDIGKNLSNSKKILSRDLRCFPILRVPQSLRLNTAEEKILNSNILFNGYNSKMLSLGFFFFKEEKWLLKNIKQRNKSWL